MILLPLLLAVNAAARYDPGPVRAILRQTATACHTTIVDATGLTLEPEKIPAITAGIDAGADMAAKAGTNADVLGSGAKARQAEMTKGADAIDKTVKELAGPVADQRKRKDKGSAELAEMKTKIEKYPEDERKKFEPRVEKAERALKSAEEALLPAEAAVRAMEQRALEMKAADKKGRKASAETIAEAAAAVERSSAVAAPAAEVKARLPAIGIEPKEANREKVREAVAVLRGETLGLFQAADRACNRADDFRRASAAYDDASEALEKARPAANPADAKAAVDAADKAVELVRELLKNSAPHK